VPAYYNEIDRKAAAWLRELIKRGIIAPGDVDERSIEDVRPDELMGYTQCHFFAGIGVWSYALRSAGWPDDRPVWTGSCPCQPFSTAGKRGGFADERHLWPAWYHLISQCRPVAVFGEQVASKDGLAWFDTVQADMEGAGYAVGAPDLCAAGFGAPHIRQRLYFVANALRWGNGHRPRQSMGAQTEINEKNRSVSRERLRIKIKSTSGRMAYAKNIDRGLSIWSEQKEDFKFERSSTTGGMDNGISIGRREVWKNNGKHDRKKFDSASRINILDNASRSRCKRDGLPALPGERNTAGTVNSDTRPSATNGFWHPADWLLCRDGKARPAEPGTFLLAHGAAERVGRLRGYGNAIVAPVAIEFIKSFMEAPQ